MVPRCATALGQCASSPQPCKWAGLPTLWSTLRHLQQVATPMWRCHKGVVLPWEGVAHAHCSQPTWVTMQAAPCHASGLTTPWSTPQHLQLVATTWWGCHKGVVLPWEGVAHAPCSQLTWTTMQAAPCHASGLPPLWSTPQHLQLVATTWWGCHKGVVLPWEGGWLPPHSVGSWCPWCPWCPTCA
jgi:hypothetical protein